MKNIKAYLGAFPLSLGLLCAPVQAATIYSDNFDAAPLGGNSSPPGWLVAAGTVDTIGTGFFDFLPGNGHYIDLDGGTFDAGVLSRQLSLIGGTQYVATFDLAGSQRGDSNTVSVVFGTTVSTFTRASSDPFATFSLTFTPTTTASFTLSFANNGGDNVGALLDRVVVDSVVSAIPEPETYAMMLAGLGLLGFAARRRKQAQAA